MAEAEDALEGARQEASRLRGRLSTAEQALKVHFVLTTPNLSLFNCCPKELTVGTHKQALKKQAEHPCVRPSIVVMVSCQLNLVASWWQCGLTLSSCGPHCSRPAAIWTRLSCRMSQEPRARESYTRCPSGLKPAPAARRALEHAVVLPHGTMRELAGLRANFVGILAHESVTHMSCRSCRAG